MTSSQKSEPNKCSAEKPGNEYTIPELLKFKQWLENKSVEYSASKIQHGGESDTSNAPTDLAQLQKELYEASCGQSQKELILKRLQLSHTLANNLDQSYNPPEDELAPDFESLKDLTEEQTTIVSDILDIQNEIDQLNQKLTAIQHKNVNIKEGNRELMSAVHQIDEERGKKGEAYYKNEKIHRAKDSLDNTVSKVDMVRHILQGLVIGSGINWGQDDEMAEFVVSLGIPLDI